MKPTLALFLLMAGCGKPKLVQKNTVNEHWVGIPTENCHDKDGNVVIVWGTLPAEPIFCSGPAIDKPPSPKVAAPSISHEAIVYAELWKVCKEKHLSYRVTCDSTCWAIATNEDGDDWVEDVGSSGPTAAAKALLRSLKANEKPFSYGYGHKYVQFDTGEVRP